jgi:Skp family chaperone for outer membrane proteins
VKARAILIEGLLQAARSTSTKLITNIMTQATDIDIKELKDLIQGLDKKIEVGFANIDTKFAKVEGQINTVEAKLEGKIDKLDERTKLGFWGFIFRGVALAALAALTAIFVKYLFPILPPSPLS